MAAIFISYARADQGLAEQVDDALRAVGHTTWWDHSLTPQHAWPREIQAQLDAADVVLVCLTPDAVASDWVQREMREGRSKLAPGLFRPCKLPVEFNDLQYADLIDWDGSDTHRGWQKLLGWIERLIRGDVLESAGVDVSTNSATASLVDKLDYRGTAVPAPTKGETWHIERAIKAERQYPWEGQRYIAAFRWSDAGHLAIAKLELAGDRAGSDIRGYRNIIWIRTECCAPKWRGLDGRLGARYFEYGRGFSLSGRERWHSPGSRFGARGFGTRGNPEALADFGFQPRTSILVTLGAQSEFFDPDQSDVTDNPENYKPLWRASASDVHRWVDAEYSDFAWSSDGDWFVHTSLELDDAETHYEHAFATRTFVAEQPKHTDRPSTSVRLPEPGFRYRHPVVSPSGRFVHFLRGMSPGNIVDFDREDCSEVELPNARVWIRFDRFDSCWHPNRDVLAILGGTDEKHLADRQWKGRTVFLYDPYRQQVVHEIDVDCAGVAHGLAWSPSGRYLAVGGEDQSCVVIDLSTAKQQKLFGHTEPATYVEFSRDEQRLLSCANKEVIMWGVSNGERLGTWTRVEQTASFPPRWRSPQHRLSPGPMWGPNGGVFALISAPNKLEVVSLEV